MVSFFAKQVILKSILSQRFENKGEEGSNLHEGTTVETTSHPHTINQILISNPYTSQLYIRTLHSHLILILMLHTPYQSRHLGYWALGSQNSCYIHLEPHRNHSVHPHTINQILISNPYTSQLYIRTLHSHLILILMHARASRLLGLRLISRIFSVRMIS